ncbi:hypothetical protein ASG43_17765 [Aureimonas sp. Leaf454]|uniref:Arc family DNA-binding protein n=1 Tax=Aureimonas sp. Leaf454 TaxID=1736381 RepID=UPI0006FB1ADB|nr:Arc family DNA-binding protein [Aureimonas sp. Leaf454]KQT53684.1 hypothetical protein ASG43_17765 [Aureimonas sp. Leaf454]
MDDKFPSEAAERFQVRMPDGMRDRLRVAAEKNNRSMNAEIIDRLERSLAGVDAEETFSLMLNPEARIKLARHRLRQVLDLLDEYELAEMI